eukprot:TRINITY_DN15059_c0_g1_i5.p1 TRINITY_DN15059_c0_g1~~TRINITY_DN15059_c0_g1_i5.p1  ORF type:complete len:145 (-),score=33.89 TRINITY_DN15059_c0_g1_i5:29-463(-)
MTIDPSTIGDAPKTTIETIRQLRAIATSIQLVHDQVRGEYSSACLQAAPDLTRQLEVSGLWVESRSSATSYGILSNQWMILWNTIQLQLQDEDPSQKYARVKKLWVPTQHLSLIHISEPTRLLSISYAVFCLKKKNKKLQRFTK